MYVNYIMKILRELGVFSAKRGSEVNQQPNENGSLNSPEC